MPTRGYVEDRFKKGMDFEKWVEDFFRDNFKDVKMAKRTDSSEKPHEHEDIKDIPSEPDMKIHFDGKVVEVWITHKNFGRDGWRARRSSMINSMYWRWKTWKFMKSGHYLLYGILENGTPHEVVWEKFDDVKYVGEYRDGSDANQDDLRASLDMSKSLIIFKDGKVLYNQISDIVS